MRKQYESFYAVVSWGFCIAALLVGCGGTFGEDLRERTYPPNFNYIPAERLDSTMGQLAVHASKLDRLLHERAEDPPRQEVIRLLLALEQTSAALGSGGWPSNHPRVSHNIDDFRRDVAAARRAVELEPPSYVQARSVTDSCVNCHQGR